MPNIKHENMNIYYNFRFPHDQHKDYIQNLVRVFGVHYMNFLNKNYNWKVNNMEICKQDSRGSLSVTVLSGSRHVKQEWHGETGKELIKFMQGFIFDKPWIQPEEDSQND